MFTSAKVSKLVLLIGESERGYLAILKTLRNKATPEVRKFLPRNDPRRGEYSLGCVPQRSTLHNVELCEKLWKRCQGRLEEDNPLGGVLFYKSEVLVCCTRTSCDPVSHTSNSTVTTCTDGTIGRTEDKGLGANTWCCRASVFCQTGDSNSKSWNSPIVPIKERDSAG